MNRLPVSLLLSLLCVVGCTTGLEHRYHGTVVDLSYHADGADGADGRVAVATRDARPYILDGDKDPDFVGLVRGGYGNPFDVTTESGRPLANEVTGSVSESLKKAGFDTVEVTPARGADEAEVLASLAETGAGRLLLLTLTEWKADSYMNTALLYDVELEVHDSGRTLLADKHLKGRDNLGGSFWNSPGHAGEAVPAAFKRKLAELLEDPSVAAAISKD